MQTLLAHDVEAFLSKFYHCADGVLREVRLDFISPTHKPCGFVELSTRDSKGSGESGWVNLRLQVENLVEFRLSKGDREDCVVLSDGIRIHHVGGGVFLDLGGGEAPEPGTPEQHRASSFYLAGEALLWELVAYRE